MSLSQATLSKVESVATIGAAAAIPLVIAICGFLVQGQLGSAGLKRDYVSIAVGILKDKNQDPELRRWAVDVLDHYAPVKLTAETKHQLLIKGP